MKVIFLLLLSINIYANLDLAPPSFEYSDGIKGVFIDIIKSHSELNFTPGSIDIETLITFKTKEDGFPLFDLVGDIDVIKLAKKDKNVIVQNNIVHQTLINPPGQSIPMRMILSKVKANTIYSATIKHRFLPEEDRPELSFKENRLSFYFKFCDGKGVRQLLERYIPSNL